MDISKREVDEVKELPEGEISRLVKKINSLQKEEFDEIKKRTIDYLYDWRWCKARGIKYADREEIKKYFPIIMICEYQRREEQSLIRN